MSTDTVSQNKLFSKKAVHLILQGKGGVGKSLVASLLIQFLRDSGEPVSAIDTDPLNDSLSQVSSLEATRLDLLDEGTSFINPIKFDSLIADILNCPDRHFVVDNGTASFLPLFNYLVQSEVVGYLRENGRRVLIHMPIVAGTSYLDTVQCFDSLATTFGEGASLIPWLNPFFGAFKDPFAFLKSSAFLQHQPVVPAVIEIPPFRNSLFAHAFDQMLYQKQSIADAISSPHTQIMAKQRLTIYRRELYPILEAALCCALNVRGEAAHS